jgi:hypothetical protein
MSIYESNFKKKFKLILKNIILRLINTDNLTLYLDHEIRE